MSVAEGLRLDLSAMSGVERHALIRLLARISEASYRRGFQQGCYLRGQGEISDEIASNVRHSTRLDWSPRGEDGLGGMSSTQRLNWEYGLSLADIGLRIGGLDIQRSKAEGRS